MTYSAVPTVTDAVDEPVVPGFEQIAKVCDRVCEGCLLRDLTLSPAMQQLVDDEGGEHR